MMRTLKKPTRKEKGVRLTGVDVDLEIVPLMEKRIEDLGVSKRKYLNALILKDLGLKEIPARVIPSRYVPIDTPEEIEKDEESV